MPRLMMLCSALVVLGGVGSAQAPATQPRPDPKTIQLRGDRFKPLTYDEMTPAQRTMIEHVLAGPRGSTDGPFNVQLRSPEMGDLGQQFGASTRFATTVPRKLYELEMGALRAGTAPLAQWMAAAGHNFSIPTRAFLDAGGFSTDISINEHRELALRLCRANFRMVPVEGAISLHLTHREGYRDPMTGEDGWELAFARRHPYETQLMMRFWRSLASDSGLAPEERVSTLERVHELLHQHLVDERTR